MGVVAQACLAFRTLIFTWTKNEQNIYIARASDTNYEVESATYPLLSG